MRPEESMAAPQCLCGLSHGGAPCLPFPATAAIQGRPALHLCPCLPAQTVAISGLGKAPPHPSLEWGLLELRVRKAAPALGPKG